jgi:ABC-2 type transport system permease protein
MDNRHRGPAYARVFLTMLRNSLVRDMSFRANFIIESLTSACWMLMNLGFYLLVFRFTRELAPGWGKHEFFAFLATTMMINSLVQTFFMPNAEEFSELIRTGNLDFALLKPIDTQFLVSLQRVDWSSLSNFVLAWVLLAYSLVQMTTRPVDPLPLRVWMVVAYPVYVACGVAILYSLMISLAATSIWLGRNQSLYDFWFYITNFSRYPMEIYEGRIGTPLRLLFTFVVPVMIVVNVPARVIARPLIETSTQAVGVGLDQRMLLGFALFATCASLIASRWLFHRALLSYRSASS